MKIKELETRLNEFVISERLNTLEKQGLQYNLIAEIKEEVRKLLMPYGLNCYIVAKRNHIAITDFFSYPIENALVDIIIRFKKGTEHSKYYYTQYYYINKIEVISKDENIQTLTDVKNIIEKNDEKREQIKQKKINDLKKFMNSKNITYDEMVEYSELFKKYKFILKGGVV